MATTNITVELIPTAREPAEEKGDGRGANLAWPAALNSSMESCQNGATWCSGIVFLLVGWQGRQNGRRTLPTSTSHCNCSSDTVVPSRTWMCSTLISCRMVKDVSVQSIEAYQDHLTSCSVWSALTSSVSSTLSSRAVGSVFFSAFSFSSLVVTRLRFCLRNHHQK